MINMSIERADCLSQNTFAFSSTRYFRCVLWPNDTSYSKSVCLNGQ